MAVVLGVEYNKLFDCGRNDKKCDQAYVDSELDKIYDLGIRSVFPVHRHDNAFGGAKAGGIEWMYLSNKLDSGYFSHLIELALPWKNHA